MKFLDTVTVLADADSGGLINGRIELYSQKRAGGEKKEAKALIIAKKGETGSTSDTINGQLIVDLIQTMNASHNDNDFSALTAESFTALPLNDVIRDVNEHLVEHFTRPSFLSDMWKEIDRSIGGLAKIDGCFKLQDGCCPFAEDLPLLWTFHYFLYSKEEKRICYITCVAVNKARKASIAFYDDEVPALKTLCLVSAVGNFHHSSFHVCPQDDDGSEMDVGSDGDAREGRRIGGDSDDDEW